MTHTQNPPGNQSERNTSCVDSLISDKPNSKKKEERDKINIYRERERSHKEQEMRGYTQIEGQSTQGSDK